MVCKSGCKKKCCEVTLINSDDITQSGVSGKVLYLSGYYKLCEDVDWYPSVTGQYAIVISGTDITLDLDGHTLKQTNTAIGECALVYIAPNSSNTRL